MSDRILNDDECFIYFLTKFISMFFSLTVSTPELHCYDLLYNALEAENIVNRNCIQLTRCGIFNVKTDDGQWNLINCKN